MTSIMEIEDAFKLRFDELVRNQYPDLPVAWPNEVFVPPVIPEISAADGADDGAYLRWALNHVTSVRMLDHVTNSEVTAVLTVGVFAPANFGERPAKVLARDVMRILADEIRIPGLSLVRGPYQTGAGTETDGPYYLINVVSSVRMLGTY